MIKWFEKIKTKRLIQKSVDNALSESEKKELDRLLNKNPDLKQYYDSLYAIDQNLKNFLFNEGATDVSDAVMKKVMESKKHDESYQFPGNRNAGILYSSAARYAAAAVLGILIGVGSMILVSQNNMVKTEQVYGTLMAGNSTEGITFSASNTHIRMIPYVQKDLLYLNFFTDTKDSFDIEVIFNSRDYIPIAQQSGTTTRMNDIRFDTGRVSFSCIGQTSAQLIIRKKTENPGKPLRIKVFRNRTEVFTKKISP